MDPESSAEENPVPESAPAPDLQSPPAVSPAESTVGTGSVIGIGCTIFVLVFICIGSLIIFPLAQQVTIGGDVFAAALYFVNWHFIVQGVDYFAAADGLHSPVQH